jgi:hypothetical protein
VQSGNVDPGGTVHTYFPAIYSNQFDDVAMVMGASSSTTRISVNAAGRRASDPPGTMSALTQLQLSPVNTGGRWGDYYDIAVDPLDDARFWVVGEYGVSAGWANWIDSFWITEPACPGDVNGDGSVTLDDLAVLLANFGTLSGAAPEDGDTNGDGDVDLDDLAFVLANFGATCP